ncbi:hypothetical protein NQZ68_027469 [Dissostichus eleginoides]|nr:hypothetical protein NQZ68_027469 [Dissostichus eleginoides]
MLSGDIHPCPVPGFVSIDLTAGGPAAELHAPSVGFRRGWLAERLAPPAGLCGLTLTAADLAAGPLPTPSEDYGSTPRAGGRAAEIHTPPDTTGHHRTGFRRGRLAEQLALPAGLCGLALTAAGRAAGPTSTPSEDWGPAPRAKSTAAENHASPAGCTQGRLAKQLARPEDLCGLAPAAAGLASGPTYTPLSGETPHLTCGPRLRINDTPVPVPPVQGALYDTIRQD